MVKLRTKPALENQRRKGLGRSEDGQFLCQLQKDIFRNSLCKHLLHPGHSLRCGLAHLEKRWQFVLKGTMPHCKKVRDLFSFCFLLSIAAKLPSILLFLVIKPGRFLREEGLHLTPFFFRMRPKILTVESEHFTRIVTPVIPSRYHMPGI